MLIISCIILASFVTGCTERPSAYSNEKRKEALLSNDEAQEEFGEANGIGDTSIINDIDYGLDTEKDADTITEGDASTEVDDDPEYQAFLDNLLLLESQEAKESSSETKDFGEADASGRVGYNCDIEKDKQDFDGKADIVVGDNLYTTQINDWYTNFDIYEGKTVEIEGYYIDDYAPYTFVGRFGPTCQYCVGGYVSFEFYTQDDLSALKSLEDWIKVTGVLRQGEDSTGVFYYIEVLSLIKMDKIGKDTVTN
jgi:hypothetical protein